MRLTPLDSFGREIPGQLPGLQVCSLPAEAPAGLSGFIKALTTCHAATPPPKKILYGGVQNLGKELKGYMHHPQMRVELDGISPFAGRDLELGLRMSGRKQGLDLAGAAAIGSLLRDGVLQLLVPA